MMISVMADKSRSDLTWTDWQCWLVLSLVLLSCGLVAGQSARVTFEDGRSEVGRLKDWSSRRRDVKFEDQDLFKRRPRIVQFDDRATQLSAPYLLMANGDVLPGRPVATVHDTESQSRWLQVQLSEGLSSGERGGDMLNVRLDQVRAIILRDGICNHPDHRLIDHGLLVFANGRRVPVKAVRLTGDGVMGLDARQMVKASWSELAELWMPQVDVLSALLRDGALAGRFGNADDTGLSRVTLRHGAVLSWPRPAMRVIRKGREYYHLVQPVWSESEVRFAVKDEVMRSFRSPVEIPLSLCPVVAVEQTGFIGYRWPWRMNRNVRGGTASVGGQRFDLAIGVHAVNRLSFELPAQSERLGFTVGLDDAVGAGGCVRCKVRLGGGDGRVIWQSDYLTGRRAPAGPRGGWLKIDGANILTLQTDAAHDGRPEGSDPMDIRDQVDWLMPLVQISSSALPDRWQVLGWYWQLPVDLQLQSPAADQLQWDRVYHDGSYRLVLLTDQPGQVFRRQLTVPRTSSQLVMAMAVSDRAAGAEMTVQVNGQPIPTVKGKSALGGRWHHSWRADEAVWDLSAWAGQPVTVTIHLKGVGSQPAPSRGGIGLWSVGWRKPASESDPS